MKLRSLINESKYFRQRTKVPKVKVSITLNGDRGNFTISESQDLGLNPNNPIDERKIRELFQWHESGDEMPEWLQDAVFTDIQSDIIQGSIIDTEVELDVDE